MLRANSGWYMHTSFCAPRQLPTSARFLSLFNLAISRVPAADFKLNQSTVIRRERAGVQLLTVILTLCALSGTFAMAAVAASPTGVSWSSVAVGTEGGQKVVTLTNGGTTTLTISGISITGTNVPDFTIFSKTCGTTLAVSASCTANVIFGPTAAGTRTANLLFTDNSTNSPHTVTLSGTGTSSTGGSASVSPTSLTWASVTLGNIGGAKTTTLTNSGSTALSISSIAISGT